MRQRLLWAAALILSTVHAPARALDLDGGYARETDRHTDRVARGFNVGVSQGLGNYFWFGVAYSQLRTQPFTDAGVTGREEYLTGEADLGAGYAFARWIELGAAAGYAESAVRGQEGFAHAPIARSHGPTGSLSVTLRPTSEIAFSLGPAYSYVGGEPAWQGTANLGLKLWPGAWLNLGYWSAQLKDGWSASLRFGK